MSVVYLYGFVPAETRLPVAGLLGIGDAEVRLVDVGGFAAVTARLPEARFGKEALDTATGDVEWMARQGLRHEQVVAWFVDHASILPSRLLTLFSSEDALRARASDDAEAIRTALDRFDGLREWDLKVEFDAAVLEGRLGQVSEVFATLDREIGTASPGKQFLLRKKRQELARTETRAAARRLAHELLAGLEPIAEEVARVPLADDNAPCVISAALLIERAREEEGRAHVAAEARRLADLGLTVFFTGPWAPYRFLEVEHEP